MKEYPKIPGPYKRNIEPGPDRNKIIEGLWTSPELRALADTSWTWTEKVDGTNIRVHWNGHAVTLGGRTANAQIPAKLVAVLQTLFTEELFEQVFQDGEATLYGEGYGAGIQSGGIYRQDQSFVLFDVVAGGFWLRRPDVMDVADKFGIESVPVVLSGPISEAINYVRRGFPSRWEKATPEGLVGTAPEGILDRAGRRIMVKVKTKDFQ